MNLLALPNFLAATLILAAGVLAAMKNKKSKINLTFFLLAFSACIWQIGTGLAVLTRFPDFALIGTKIGFFGIVLIPVFSYHISLYISDIKKYKILIGGYICAFFIFIPLSWTSLILDGVHKYPWGYFFKAGPLHPIFMVFFIFFMVLAFFNLFFSYKNENNPLEKNRKKYFLAALFMAYIGSIDYLPTYGFQMYPFGYLMLICFISIFAYAIAKYSLMDIDVVIKKTLVFASLFAISFGVFVSITVLTQELIAGGRLLGLAISSIIIILSVRPLEDFLIRITDKYLFQKRYDYKHLIRQFMEELKTMVLNANDIAQSTVDFLDSSIRADISAVFIYNKFTNHYDIIASSNFKYKNLMISDSSSIVKELNEKGKIINLDVENKNIPAEEKKDYKGKGIRLIIPLLIHNELLGMVLLGKKKSDEDYTQEDIEAISDLSGALSITINNAQLFDERADAEKRAMIGTLATGINHEIGNPLNIISIKLQSFRILAKQGLLDKKSKEEIIDEVNNITDVCLSNAQRISEITKKISEFAKPNKKIAMDRVNIDEVIDETMSILSHELLMDKIKFDKTINCNEPIIKTDRGQLKQILFNLIKNAAQAIGKSEGNISVLVDRQGKDKVAIRTMDNGPGIPKKALEKVFMPFYTTKEPGKGTGLGLALVKKLVERNDGEIKVESEEGKGTTFTLIFKGCSDE